MNQTEKQADPSIEEHIDMPSSAATGIERPANHTETVINEARPVRNRQEPIWMKDYVRY